MATGQSLHMNQGEGEASYARNSMFQSAEQNRMKPIIEEAVTGLLQSTKSHSSMAIADLGCSSGPNALALVSGAVDAILHHCASHEQIPPELCVFLNDLPDNDFNNVAKSLVQFQERDQRIDPVMVGIVPGSFYKRLFRRNSLHLVLASSSVHWLSEAPEYLRNNGIAMYDGDDDLRQARRPLVAEAYARQFRKDFKLFLNLRAQELVPGGKMVISLVGRRAGDNTWQTNLVWNPMAFILNDMAVRGVINREKFKSFYIPMHAPSDKELREIIKEESSFKIDKMLVHEIRSGMNKSSMTPEGVGLAMRALYEPMVVQHFGRSDQVVEEIVRTTERHVSMGNRPFTADNFVFLCVSLTNI